MAATIVEQTRTFHEDIERLEQAAIQFLAKETKTNKDRIHQEHLARISIDRLVDCKKQLADLYRDEDGLKREEISSIGASVPAVFSLFYDRLRDLKGRCYHFLSSSSTTSSFSHIISLNKEYHRKFYIELPKSEDSLPSSDDLQLHFTGEESYGRYFDLHYLFDQYINLPKLKDKNIEYLEFLSKFYKFDNSLEGNEYESYLRDLLYYLVDWIHRVHPLFDVQQLLKEFEDEFQKDWDAGTRGWKNEGAEGGGGSLYCEYCKRDFAKSTVFKGHLSGKKHQQAFNAASSERNERRRSVFQMEYKVFRIASLLEDVLEATKENIVKKQARNYSENVADLEEEEEDEDDSQGNKDEEDEDNDEGRCSPLLHFLFPLARCCEFSPSPLLAPT
jgi:splicing factor 3A subunit 3